MERARKTLILNRVVKEGSQENQGLRNVLKEIREQAPFYNWDRMFQAEGIGSAKALGQEHAQQRKTANRPVWPGLSE